jgi:riboflavin kinase/FMN adenylyltransferase
MMTFDGPPDEWEVPGPTALTIGVYDGIHRGHQEVIAQTRNLAGDTLVAVLTFDGHPLTLSAPDHAPQLLTNRRQKLELLEQNGVDVVGMLRFDETLRRMPPDEFIERVIVGAMQASVVVVGRDFRFGFERAGDVDLLSRRGEELGFRVQGVDLFGGAVPVSSTSVRRALDTGDVVSAARMLGRRFELMGPVVAGDRRGRSIGYPTANVAVPPSTLLPRQGVYSVAVAHDRDMLNGVVNIGVRPTFGAGRVTVEVHILDFEGDLYGDELRLQFVDRIRGEQRFGSIEELVSQIETDVAVARRHLASAPSSAESEATGVLKRPPA